MAADDPIPVKDKLVRIKEDWAKSGRGLTGQIAPPHQRCPPGQHVTDDFPVLDLGIQPGVPLKDWSLTVAGEIERPLKWTWAMFMAQPQVTLTNDIHCVTTWSRYDNVWTGVSMRTVLAQAGLRPAAKFLMMRCYDGYTANLPLADLDRDDVLIAHSWQGKLLAREHGGPARLVVPHLYFWKSAKWLRHIAVMPQDQPGYWEARGYHMRGDPWKEERYG